MNERMIFGIAPAAEIRERTKRTEAFEGACRKVMADIQKAAAEGRYHTMFNPMPHHLADDIQSAFEKEGYTFRAAGMVAGVLQRDKYICW